jgi:hypothetical protein
MPVELKVGLEDACLPVAQHWRACVPFVSEFISNDDVEKFGLQQIDGANVVGGTNARDWVIDRDRDSYLRNVAHGGGAEPELRDRTAWSFRWRGALLTLRLDLVKSGSERRGAGWSRWNLIWVNGGEGLPVELKPFRDEFLDDLIAALSAHHGFGGAYSKHTQYQAEVEASEGCVL